MMSRPNSVKLKEKYLISKRWRKAKGWDIEVDALAHSSSQPSDTMFFEGRSLSDALEGFIHEKTVWLGPDCDEQIFEDIDDAVQNAEENGQTYEEFLESVAK